MGGRQRNLCCFRRKTLSNLVSYTLCLDPSSFSSFFSFFLLFQICFLREMCMVGVGVEGGIRYEAPDFDTLEL